MDDKYRYRVVGLPQLRIAHLAGCSVPPPPEAAATAARWLDWLSAVWALPEVAGPVGHATPALESRVRVLVDHDAPAARDIRRAGLSTLRYVRRLSGRPTPSGLLAGVCPAAFGDLAALRWHGEHRAVARADGTWVAQVVRQLERSAEVLRLLQVVANSAVVVRDDRVIVPSGAGAGGRGTEVSVRRTSVVTSALAMASEPVVFADLAADLARTFGARDEIAERALTELVTHGVLVSALHAPATDTDALTHVIGVLTQAGAASEELREVARLLELHEGATVHRAGLVRAEAAARMRTMAQVDRHPVAIDVRVGADISLPWAVAVEAEKAASLLARVTALPFGSAEWRDYHERFYRRYGGGALVPLLELTGGGGIGWPVGYEGGEPVADADAERARRDGVLGALAQRAVLDGDVEVDLDGTVVRELQHPRAADLTLPGHLELCVRVDAGSLADLDRGRFDVTVVSVSRAAGVLTGRFGHLLETEDRLSVGASALPTGDALLAQLSFPASDDAEGHVVRSPQSLPLVISLAEHRAPSSTVLTARDLAVGSDGDRLYLAAPALGRRIEAWGHHALSLRRTPPLARLITELSRGQCAQVTGFDWGAAAALPFLPRLRFGRVVLSPARWLVTAAEVPHAGEFGLWDVGFGAWRIRRRLPGRVLLLDGDRRLPLELEQSAHRAMVREQLTRRGRAILVEAPGPAAAGWCEGRPAELVVPLAVTQAARSVDPPPVGRAITSEHRRLPGRGRALTADLYGDAALQDAVLRHVPHLIEEFEGGVSQWWFVRYRQGREHCLRLHIDTPRAGGFAAAVERVGRWAEDLCGRGLARDLTLVTTTAQSGRFGSGAALTAAGEVFAADAELVVNQLQQRVLPDLRALTAAHQVAMACQFHADVAAGLSWIVEHLPRAAVGRTPRGASAEAVRLVADAAEGFPSLRRAVGGSPETEAAWERRRRALAAYRRQLRGPAAAGLTPDTALEALLHGHFLRGCGIDPADKALYLSLARAAAQAQAARTRVSS